MTLFSFLSRHDVWKLPQKQLKNMHLRALDTDVFYAWRLEPTNTYLKVLSCIEVLVRLGELQFYFPLRACFDFWNYVPVKNLNFKISGWVTLKIKKLTNFQRLESFSWCYITVLTWCLELTPQCRIVWLIYWSFKCV